MSTDILSQIDGAVGIIRLNRPAAHNALSESMIAALFELLRRFEDSPDVRCTLIAGDERAFASGVDLGELLNVSLVDLQQRDPLAAWDLLLRLTKPIVAAACGYALGTGCELLLASDIIIAGDNLRLGQPQISLGIIPGCGATQRLPRLIGRARTLDLILTGRTLSAREALEMGLVSRVVPRENCYDVALGVCRELCTRPPLAVRRAKEAVGRAFEVPLAEGLRHERALHYALFATDDQKEGMRAFLEKRPPIFAGR